MHNDGPIIEALILKKDLPNNVRYKASIKMAITVVFLDYSTSPLGQHFQEHLKQF